MDAIKKNLVMLIIQERIEVAVLNQDAKTAIKYIRQNIEKIIKNLSVLRINAGFLVGI